MQEELHPQSITSMQSSHLSHECVSQTIIRNPQMATGGHAMMGQVAHCWRRGQSIHDVGSKSMEEILQFIFC